MEISATEDNKSDYDINIRMIAVSVAAIVVILVAISFIKTCAEQKQHIMDGMIAEGEIMETYYSESIDHTLYVTNLLAAQIKKNPHDPKYIKDILSEYTSGADVRDIFCWGEFAWFDHTNYKRLSSHAQNYDSRIFPMSNYQMAFVQQFSQGINYFLNSSKGNIYAAIGVKDKITKKYLGSLAVSFDLTALTRKINDRKKNYYTDFALIGEGLKIITQSRSDMEKVGLKNGNVTGKHLSKIVLDIGFTHPNNKEVAFLDMVSGVNYYVKKLPDQPFVLLVTTDHKEIQKNIFDTLVIEFVETSIFASCFLLMIILIYRRETWLRGRAEIASEIANKTTAAKSDFLAFTAHEIRSPLGPIITGSELMQKRLLGDIDKAYDDYIDGIHKNAEMILAFITDILDEAHILEGNFKIISSPHSVKDIIDNAVTINSARFANKKTNIKVTISPNLPLLICDARRILQVVNNLTSNAIKYSPDGSVVKFVAKIKNKKLHIEVIDKGVGMSSSEIATALEKYGTVRKKNFDFIESYGLGLPIVQKLLEAHGAEFIIESKIDVGTKTIMIFPQDRLVY